MKFVFHRSRNARLVRRKKGFALVVTLSLLILLVILATGLLSLSAVSLRASVGGESMQKARANARMAVMLAIAELQKSAGDDRRVTADASVLDSSSQPNLVGVWESWSPNLRSAPTSASANYNTVKGRASGNSGNFRKWLVSHPDYRETAKIDFAEGDLSSDSLEVFNVDTDGFEISATRVPLSDGGYAWAVSQEGTRAKINVDGPENNQRNPNDDIQAQARPNLSLSDRFKQPSGDWNARSSRVISLNQAALDGSLASGSSLTSAARADYTAHSMGLLTDVVNGGLKVDLNLGFEMSDLDFEASSWGSVPNPFHAGAADFNPALPGNIASSYKGQRPLFRPLTNTATHTARLDNFDVARARFDYPGAGIPTFHTLRSFYRIPHHLYTTQEGLTVFGRTADHVAFSPTPVPGGMYPTPWAPPPAVKTQGSIQPVVDRVMFLLSAGVHPTNNRPLLVITPVITMWNPYNVALEIEGAVAYPWLDVPFNLDFRIDGGTNGRTHTHGVAGLLGRQFRSVDHGRSVDPYFYAAITGTGSTIPATGTVEPVKFRPGEVRVFAPSSPVPVPFVPGVYAGPGSNVSIKGITTYLRPVDSLSQFSTRGGIMVELSDTAMTQGEHAQARLRPATGQDYPFFISVEDATRAKGTTATTQNSRGQALVDVLQRYFGQSGEFAHGTSQQVGDNVTYNVRRSMEHLKGNPEPFAVWEFYHRYARSENMSVGGQKEQSADLVFTGNPRQPWMAHYMAAAGANFPSGPQYKIRVRGPLSDFNGLFQTEPNSNGRTALYGPTNRISSSPPGRSKLAFFEIPRAPMLSLAGFQHADLSASPYGPANQFANSWASAYIPRNRAAGLGTGSGETARPPSYDTAYLANEALWDGFFFSGAIPVIGHNQHAGSAAVWDLPIAVVTRTAAQVLENFVRSPATNPLRNPRMRLEKADLSENELISTLQGPAACTKIAAHLMVDGAFNVNSTSVEAWKAVLSGLRGSNFSVLDGNNPGSSSTAFPRFRNPMGEPDDHWNGFRTLSDGQIEALARNIVDEVKKRGPFLSLAEFVNRRITATSTDVLGLSGALQAAIDNSGLNTGALYDAFSTVGYPSAGIPNLPVSVRWTGVGIPGYLTQADVLQSLAPVITVRSDTFTIRGYGESRDKAGKITATAWCEAVVQRKPSFVDEEDDPYTVVSSLRKTNETFGRRFELVSFRYLSPDEVNPS